MTLISYHRNPQFMVTKNLIVHCESCEFIFEKDEAISLRKTEDGRIFLGDMPGDVIEIVHKTALRDLLSICLPASIEDGEDEEGDPYIKAVPLVETVSIDDLISRIPLTDSIPEITYNVVKIIN